MHKKTYYLSLKDYKKKTGEVKNSLKKEFLSNDPPVFSTKEGMSSSRREFLQLMTASLALTTASCVRRPAEKLVPYVNRPLDVIPGEANYYASSYYDAGEGFATVIKTREGRPIKVEGNAEAHLLNGHGLSPRSAAYILSLYDPQRVKGPKQNLFNDTRTNKETINISFADLDKTLLKEFNKGGLALLTPRIPSPSSQRLVQTFCRAFKAKHYVWDPLSMEDLWMSQKKSYGKGRVPSYNISEAQFIFALQCDFLGTYLSPTEFQKQFSAVRKPDGSMSRLVVLESLLSLTGSNADERYVLSSKDSLTALMALTSFLIKHGALPTIPSYFKTLVESYRQAWEKLSIPSVKWDEWTKELIRQKGKGLILFGGIRSQTKDSILIHTLVNFLNSSLNQDGRTVDYSSSYTYEFGSYAKIKNLMNDIHSGKVKRLIIHGVNPLYCYSDSRQFLETMKKAEIVVYTGDRMDETASFSHYLMPDCHPLEKWSDWEFKKKIFSIQQPAIRPLYNVRSFEDSLLVWLKISGKKNLKAENFYQYIKNYWQKRKGNSFWNLFLKKGVFVSSIRKNFISSPRKFKWNALKDFKFYRPYRGEYFLTLYETSGLKHGDLSNVAWLMEFPDPVTKICWENYVCVSPATALKKNLNEGDVVHLSMSHFNVDVPVHIQPGQDDKTLALAVGYGRTGAGLIGNKKGVNAYPFALVRDGMEFSSLPVLLRKTGKHVPLANVQGHHSMEGRDIVLETSLQEFKNDPSSGIPHHHKGKSMWSKVDYKGHKWGMTIDLNSCNGCGTCMIACQSENNIPVVGKKYVLEGREMHWIRVDRYYRGSPLNPKVVHQPVVCMHCDNAPCETVCPVLATVHSSEGTNDMIYNRCVGTRYCANNCPYKVRRFNWFDYTKQSKKEPLNLVLNPDVTVRHRGVMEKCTFCIQKIQAGKLQAKKEKRPLKDGDIKTACQASCPAHAIQFGDLNDPNSKVNKMFNASNSYALLDDMLNTKPAVKYHTKVRNTSIS